MSLKNSFKKKGEWGLFLTILPYDLYPFLLQRKIDSHMLFFHF